MSIVNQYGGKRLLLLGGSQWKDAIKRFAVQYNVTLLATGNDQSAGIFEIADESYSVNSTDSEGMKKLIHDAHVDGVYMGGSEPVIAAATEYLNELKYPCYCTREQWNVFQNKHRFKDLCRQFGLPVVPEYVLDSQNPPASLKPSDYPVIVKPADGCGSNGFSVCNNELELIAGYRKAKENSPTATVICEKFVPNTGVVVFYTFSKGRVYFSGIEDKYPVRYDKQGSYVAGLFVFESKKEKEFRLLFEKKLTSLFHSMGICEGSMWIEVFYDSGNYYFNEVGFRYGGSVSVYPVNYVSGINQIYSDLQFALSGESEIYGFPSLIDENRIQLGLHYAVYPIHSAPGFIQRFSGVQIINEMPNIVKFFVTKPDQVTIEDTGSFSQTIALAHFVFSDFNQLRDTIYAIHEIFKALSPDGRNLVLRKLDLNSIDLDL